MPAVQAVQAVKAEDQDLPLRDDIRLLGRILGDTVREQKRAAAWQLFASLPHCE